MPGFPVWWSGFAASLSLTDRQLLAAVAVLVLLLALLLRASSGVRMAILAGLAVFAAWPEARLVCLAAGAILGVGLLLARWLGWPPKPPKPY